jgi:hypothetical protein
VARSLTYIPDTLIDRTFREKIVLVGVLFPGVQRGRARPATRRVGVAGRHGGCRRGRPRRPTPRRPDAGDVPWLGQSQRAARRLSGEGLGHRRLRRHALARPAAQLREDPRSHGDRPHRGDLWTSSPRTRAPPKAKPRSSWRCCSIDLPRLRRAGGSLSQQAGGIGTRGPGETQLEVDRRRSGPTHPQNRARTQSRSIAPVRSSVKVATAGVTAK